MMAKRMRFRQTALLALLVLGIVGWSFDRVALTQAQDKQPLVKSPDDPALERTRKTVRMLDDLYKGGIVAITTHYVNERDAIPAGTAFKMLFKSVEEKGWHRVRLLDGTGEPLNDENAAEGDFEKAAVKALVDGKPWYESEIQKDGKRYLQVGTPIPVVFEKCVMCHDNYANVPKGKAIGALAYTIPIE